MRKYASNGLLIESLKGSFGVGSVEDSDVLGLFGLVGVGPFDHGRIRI